MKTLPLIGYKSLRALNTFHTLMLGLKMLPSYGAERYEAFFAKIDQMPPDDQEKLIREAVLFVELQKEEVEALACFCTDANGVPYSSENLKSLSAGQIFEIVVAVCQEVAKIKVNFVSEDEKKN